MLQTRSEATSAVAMKRRPVSVQGRALVVGALALYALMGLAAFWPVLPAQGDRMAMCACGDPVLSTWFLAWVPSAILHGHNPLLSTWINYPSGVNLAQNLQMPLLGLISAPLTLMAGPVSSLNLLLWLAFPVSAGSMFLVLRHWTSSLFSAFVGGLTYGFSAFSVNQGIDHPMLSFVPLPPLALLVLYNLLIERKGSPYHHGALLGILVVAQFFIEPELLADGAILLTLGLAILVLSNLRSITRSMVSYSARGLGCCIAIFTVLTAYPVWFMLFGSQHIVGSLQPRSNPYRTDLLGPILPTNLERFAPNWLLHSGDSLTRGGLVGNASYIGLPIFLLLIYFAIRFRRNRWLLFSAAMSVIAFILSLGSKLVVDGHQTSLPLPFILLNRFPLLSNILPVRFVLFQMVFASIVLALGSAEFIRASVTPRISRAAYHSGRRGYLRVIGPLTVVTLVALLPVVPRWPYSTFPSMVPSFFNSPSLSEIPAGSVILTYPFPYAPDDQAMLWQAEARMRFRVLGAYAQIRSSSGKASVVAPVLSPADVQEFLVYQDLGPHGYVAVPPPRSPQLVQDLQDLLTAYHVHTVIVDPSEHGSDAAINLFAEALGPPHRLGGVMAWFNLGGVG